MVHESLKDIRIGFFGAGKVAKAIATGLISKDVIEASQISLCARDIKRRRFWENLGCEWVKESYQIWQNCDIGILAVPTYTAFVGLAGVYAHPVPIRMKLWISVVHNINIAKIQSVIRSIVGAPTETEDQDIIKVIRVMPMKPVKAEFGSSVYCENDMVEEEDRARALAIFESLGDVIYVDEDSLHQSPQTYIL